MASEIKSDKLSPSTGTALQIGDASDTITIPTGATFTVTDGIGVASGGTGLASFTAGDILYATGSTTLAKLGKGTAEQVLAMNSGATAPDWGSVDLTVLPTITVAKGGTNLSSFTAGDILYATGSTTLAKLAKGSAADVLTMNTGATAPEWAAAAGGGKILQVVNNYWTTQETTTSTLGSFATMSNSVTAITPASTSNKILVMASILTGGSAYQTFMKLQHNGSGSYVDKGIGTGATGSQLNVSFWGETTFGHMVSWNYLDSPSKDSAFNYQLLFNSRAAGTAKTNSSGETTDAAYIGWTGSSLTLLEIDGT